jgi:hypothetical protein
LNRKLALELQFVQPYACIHAKLRLFFSFYKNWFLGIASKI